MPRIKYIAFTQNSSKKLLTIISKIPFSKFYGRINKRGGV